MINKKQAKKGFTIVELVIVIAVIAILAAVLIPTFTNVVSSAKESAALAEAKNAYTSYISEAKAGEYETNAIIVSGDYQFEVKEGALNTKPLETKVPVSGDGAVYTEVVWSSATKQETTGEGDSAVTTTTWDVQNSDVIVYVAPSD